MEAETTDNYKPQPRDKVKWRRIGNNSFNPWAKGVVSHVIGEDVYVMVPNIYATSNLKPKYKKRADQLILLERPGELTDDLPPL